MLYKSVEQMQMSSKICCFVADAAVYRASILATISTELHSLIASSKLCPYILTFSYCLYHPRIRRGNTFSGIFCLSVMF